MLGHGCNGIKLHSSYHWPQDDKVTAIFLATSLFTAPAELSSSDSTLLDGMVCITLHEDGLALSRKSLDTVYALHKLYQYSVSCRVLEETDVA
jgi:hypothetical protein